MYNVNAHNLLNTIEKIRPNITSLSMKNRLTRLGNALFQAMDDQINEVSDNDTNQN